jgi:hypothetical protein
VSPVEQKGGFQQIVKSRRHLKILQISNKGKRGQLPDQASSIRGIGNIFMGMLYVGGSIELLIA